MWSTLAALLLALLRAAPPLLRAVDEALAARRQREKDARVDAAIAQAQTDLTQSRGAAEDQQP